MRNILSIPILALVIVAYNIFGATGSQIEADSLVLDWALPSGAAVFFKAGDIFVVAGLVALFFEILKAARASTSIILDHMLSTATFVVALIEFILVPFCGTVAFFLIMVMTLIDVVAGFSVSILGARHDFSVNDGQ